MNQWLSRFKKQRAKKKIQDQKARQAEVQILKDMDNWPNADRRPEPIMRPFERRCMVEHGFYVHLVPLDGPGDLGAYVNFHTHGIPESHPGQLDFQIVVNVGQQSAQRIFWDFWDRVVQGERFKDGDRVSGIMQQDVLLQEVSEGHADRGHVLRILLPNSRADPWTLPGDPGHDPEFFPLQTTLDTENMPWL